MADVPKDICAERTLRDIETAKKDRVKPGMVLELCDFYETDSDLTQELKALAKATQAEKWWEHYSTGMSGRFWLMLQGEGRAARIIVHESTYVPALLQHEDYIDAVHRSVRIAWEGDQIDASVAKQLTLDRQRRWREAETPLTCVIGEAALLLNMGDEVTAVQKKHLLKLAELSYVEILVTPLSAGRHDVLGMEFSTLEFDDGSESLIYVHAGYGGRYVSPDSRAGHFVVAGFDTAKELSIPLQEFLS